MLGELELFCIKNNIIDSCQGSGKKNSRTSDHLMVIRFVIDKIVKGEKGKLFALFVDIEKYLISHQELYCSIIYRTIMVLVESFGIF